MAQLVEGAPAVLIQGSGSKPYELKNVAGVYSCSCPAWRNQSAPINKRTCKHLKNYCGVAEEAARIGSAPSASVVIAKPVVSQGNATTAKPATTSSAAASCACSRNSACDRTHSVSECSCLMCSACQRSELPPGQWYPFTEEEKGPIVAAMEKSVGRKLRQDEKTKLFGPPVLLANSLDEEEEDVDPAGWWISEKLDGVRAYWDGSQFVTRQGNTYQAPAWFTANFPKHPLDGELWMGRRQFQKTISVVKSGPSERWLRVCFMVFDAPHLDGTFEERLAAADKAARDVGTVWIKCLEHEVVRDRGHLIEKLREIESLGGEGLMLRKPNSRYESKRSSTLLKVKPFKDAEAVVIGHNPGKGRHKGVLGGLVVQTSDGKTFNVGSGMTDALRRDPPKIGVTITYRYTELTNDGVPKCASFLRVRPEE